MYNWAATLTSENNVVSENHAKKNGGGIANYAHTTTRADVTIIGSKISSNVADLNGGGIWNFAVSGVIGDVATWADVTIIGSEISSNVADLHGGGIWNFAEIGENNVAKVTVTDSTIGGMLPENGNTATKGDGGGIFNQGLNTGMIVRGSTIAQNRAANGGGGGIFNWGNTAVSGSDIYWNYAYYGGGIANWGLLVSRDSFENQIPFVWSQVHDNTDGNVWVPE